MSSQDYSRIRELFAKEIGREDEISLAGFILNGFKIFDQELNKSMLKITYPGDGKNSLQLEVVSSIQDPELPDLSGVEISGNTGDISRILELVKGDISAEFADLVISQKVERDGTMGKLGAMQLYFSPSGNGDVLKKATISRSYKRTRKEFSRREVDPRNFELLRQAKRMTITNSSFHDDDPRKDLIQESCLILKPSDYLFRYKIKAANHLPLPIETLDRVAGVYDLVGKNFYTFSYRRRQVEKINARSDND